jgi:polyisoprenoid-binding protein YceI
MFPMLVSTPARLGAAVAAALVFSHAGAARAAGDAAPSGVYAVDPAHTKVGFEVPHLVISTVEGRFDGVDGKVEWAGDPTKAKIEAKIDAATVDTSIKDRDEHLRSPDFFDVKKFPQLTFKSTKIEGTPDALTVTGELTIKGVTRTVVLAGKYLGHLVDPWGNDRIAFKADGKINRKDFGLTWGKMVEAGPVVGDEVALSLKVEATKSKKTASN